MTERYQIVSAEANDRPLDSKDLACFLAAGWLGLSPRSPGADDVQQRVEPAGFEGPSRIPRILNASRLSSGASQSLSPSRPPGRADRR